MRQPNPFDPLDDAKRWFHELWPMQQLGVIVGIIMCAAVLILWAIR